MRSGRLKPPYTPFTVAEWAPQGVRDAGIKLQEWFTINAASEPVGGEARQSKKRGEGNEPENKPLTFELKGIDSAHPYLAQRGITKETAETFGVGVFSGRGSMSGRLVIPIHNEGGELVAYAGRSIDGREPRYKLPAGFHKSQVLFNLHRITGPDVIVVEGFFDCMKVWQAGCQTVVAVMGSTLSEHQERLLVERFKKLMLLLDGDEASPGGTLRERLPDG